MRRGLAQALVLCATCLGVTSCTRAAANSLPGLVPVTRMPASALAVLAGPPDVLADGVARALFKSAPVVVIADPDHRADLASAVRRAVRAHAPLLLSSSGASGVRTAFASGRSGPGRVGTMTAPARAALRSEVDALHPRAVLAVGVASSVLAAELPGIAVVTNPAQLPATRAPAPLRNVVLLVRQGDSPATMAAAATARVAGARVVAVMYYDPRADPGAITALAAHKPGRLLAVGAAFGPVRRLASRIAVAETGVQLPGGGQILFPMHRLIALYGHPGDPALGALGEQDLPASIARARAVAALYRQLSPVPVVPTFEIIATVAEASPGPDGSYSYESPVSLLRPWIRRATAAGMYVVLDLQPGRASLLAQAKHYRRLLRLPNVGLALDPEWKLQPGQLPLQQIGSVDVSEINEVISWLARFTARYQLPQKLLVLHQFRLSMIIGERRIDTRQDDLAIVIHMDGQGSPGDKQQTWRAVVGAAPRGVYFGWKNFYVKDHPMLSPRQTMARTPKPVMISYQ